MRRSQLYLLTTAFLVSAALPMTSLAADYGRINMGGNVKIITGSSPEEIRDKLNDLGLNMTDCLPSIPGIGQPGQPGQPDQPGTDNPGTGNPDGSTDAYINQVVQLINAERTKAGLAPVSAHAGAEAAADVRAKELERSFSHTRPNGGSFSTALNEAGVSYTNAGENIAYGQRTPEEVMNQWMNSSGHRANILSPNFTSVGVGHYKNGAGVDYWVQLFVK